ncbi:autotransporter outer membrane beta-barrel domain-containing protein [Spiribacter halobius]|uniref:autotransporter outer membrane beta-barrel domain-containing protein n=1 Tax=Sediminicurvatus halobius TaxID=2182432 RepID=UPI001304E71A|nr:autotransporter outer membrane beta-barrel domain-containing protein [Spiribacter halobius]UEX76676.1 autotransporter outer membrane beta-barrel domain-containing protein [Spiribacter halobius]
MAEALNATCPALEERQQQEVITSGEEDLLATCSTVEGAETPAETGALLSQLAEEEVFAQGRLGTTTTREQLANVDERLTQLRGGSSGIDLTGLNVAVDGERVPPLMLASAAEGVLGVNADGEEEIGADFARWGLYLNGNITRSERDRTTRESGFDADAWGITGGADYRLTDQVVLGGSLGYSRTDTSLSSDSGGIDTEGYTASLYGTWYQAQGLYFDAIVSYGVNEYDTKRRVDTSGGPISAEGEPDGDQVAVSLDGGYDLARGPWTFGFQARAVYLEADVDGYRETPSAPGATGSGSLLEIDDQRIESFITELAVQATYAISTRVGVILPTARLGWEHQFADDERDLAARFVNDPTSTTFRIRSDSPDRDYINAGAGLSAQFAQGRSAFIFAESVLGREDVTEYSVSAGVRLEF